MGAATALGQAPNRSVVAESALVRHQLLVLNRGRKRGVLSDSYSRFTARFFWGHSSGDILFYLMFKVEAESAPQFLFDDTFVKQ
jgi:hypothetical protein